MRCVIVAALLLIALPAAAVAQPEPAAAVSLTLDDAIRRGLESSHRLAEAIARGEAAEAVVEQRHAVQLPQVAATGRLRADQSCSGVRGAAAEQPAPPHLSRSSQQFPHATGCPVAPVYGRTPGSGRTCRADRGGRDCRTSSTRPAPTCASRSRARTGLCSTATETVRVVDESLVRTRAHLVDARNQLEAGAGGSQRCADRRGAGIAPADAQHSSPRESRRGGSGIGTTRRRRAGYPGAAGDDAGAARRRDRRSRIARRDRASAAAPSAPRC